MRSIQEFCELARSNPGKLSFSDKRMALESLNIRAMVEQGNLSLEGSILIELATLRQHCWHRGRLRQTALARQTIHRLFEQLRGGMSETIPARVFRSIGQPEISAASHSRNILAAQR